MNLWEMGREVQVEWCRGQRRVHEIIRKDWWNIGIGILMKLKMVLLQGNGSRLGIIAYV